MALSDEARFARQRLVPGVGDEGQARLCAATFEVGELSPEAAVVARVYLERAGLTETPSTPAAPSEDPAAAALSGARFAVRRVREALESE